MGYGSDSVFFFSVHSRVATVYYETTPALQCLS